MISILYVVVLLVNIIELLRNKNYFFFNLCSVLFMIVFVGGNTFNADYLGYQYYYNHQISSSFEPGYLWISALSSKAGLDYQHFLIILTVLSFSFILMAIYYLKVPFPTFVVLYLVTMSFLDAVQVRQFLAYAIFTVALLFLAEKKRILFIIFVLLASSFHLSAIVYVPLVLFVGEKGTSKQLIRLFGGTILLSCVFVFANGNSIPFIGNVLSRFLASEKLVYFSTRTRLGYLKYFVFQFSCIMLAQIVDRFIIREGDSHYISFSRVVNRCIKYSSFAMPLVMLNNNFMRYFKFSLIGLFILVSYTVWIFISSRYKENSPYINLIGGKIGRLDVFILLCIIFVIMYEYSIQVKSAVIDIFDNNFFL